MSLEFGIVIAGLGVLASVLVVLSEQVRVTLHRQCEQTRESESNHAVPEPHWDGARPNANAPRTPPKTAISSAQKAAAYRQVLDSFADDLEQDIAQWESVLCDFPQVLFPDAAEVPPPAEWPVADRKRKRPRPKRRQLEQIAPLERTRVVNADERDLIARLSNTGFAAEEIALWLNLPLERVQEILGIP